MKLYFSRQCGHCKNLIKMIQENSNLAQTIQAICIDTDQFPQMITNVPTIEYGNELYIGKRAFDLVFSKKSTNEAGIHKNQPEQQSNNINKGVMPMEGGDGYTFIKNESQEGFRFRQYNGLNISSIHDNPPDRASVNTKLTEDTDTKPSSGDIMDILKKQREQEIPLPHKRV
jgi:hypothetical protein